MHGRKKKYVISTHDGTSGVESQDARANRKSRNRSIQFVVVFVLGVFIVYGGYQYAVDSEANSWYLFKVASHTALVLDKIGYSTEQENISSSQRETTYIRAYLAAIERGEEPPFDKIRNKEDEPPLTAWEKFRYRQLKASRTYEKQKDRILNNKKLDPALRARRLHELEKYVGPYVRYIARPGLSMHIRDLRNKIKELSESYGPETKPQIEALRSELKDLEARKKELSPEELLEANKSKMMPFSVIPECGAIEVMAIFASAVLAFPARWKKRILGIIIGIPVLYGVNILRLTCLAIIGAWYDRSVFNFAHEYVWQGIYIVFVLFLWLVWVEFDKLMSKERGYLREVLLICLKFCVIGPLCLVLWWWISPWYGWCLGQISGGILQNVFREPIVAFRVHTNGLLNTTSQLVFARESGGERKMWLCYLITNYAPFVALILSTGGMGILRRLKALGIGSLIIFTGHIFILTIMYKVAPTGILAAMYSVFHTLPFLLWIILAFWGRLSLLFTVNSNNEKPNEEAVN